MAPSAHEVIETTMRKLDFGEPCWILPVTVNGVQLDMLVDTGANKTLMDINVFKKCLADFWDVVHKDTLKMVAANDTAIKVHGELELDLDIAGKSFPIMVTVAQLGNVDGILGMDFLRRQNVTMELGTGFISLDGKSVPLIDREHKVFHGCRIRATKEFEIPPQHEITVNGFLDNIPSTGRLEIGTLDPLSSFTKETGLMMANALVDAKSDSVPVTLLNMTDSIVQVKKGTIMATLESAEVISGEGGESILNTARIHRVCTRAPDAKIPDHLENMYQKAAVNLDEEQCDALTDVIIKYQDAFIGPDGQLGVAKSVKHSINTGSTKPIKQHSRRLPLALRKAAEEQVKSMLEKKIISPSSSPWSSPAVLVRKKDGTVRFCADYRKLNACTVKDAYPLPRIDDTLDALSGAQWYCTLDLASGFWQVEMSPQDKEKTAFALGQGLYEFNVMPFGLCNAPSTFERLMEMVLKGLQWHRCLVYLDDVVVFGKNFSETLINLQEVLTCFQDANLRLKPSKCCLFQESVTFLGHRISREGVSCDPEKLEVIKKWPECRNVREVRSFLGISSYYRRFIKGFADIAAPLVNLTRKAVKFAWNEHCADSFNHLKSELLSSSILKFPTGEGPFILDTDASNYGLGAVLSQIQDGRECVISYGSQTIARSQRSYCTTYKELLAVRIFVEKFRYYLAGRPFTVRTDHASLKWLRNFDTPDNMVMRWITFLETFDITWEHRAGEKHGNADGLSRLPHRKCKISQCEECNGGKADAEDETDGLQVELSDELFGYEEENLSVPLTVSRVKVDLSASWVYPVHVLPHTTSETQLSGTVAVNSAVSDYIDQWKPEQIQEWQQADENLKLLIAWKEKDERPKYEVVKNMSSDVQALWHMWGEIELKDGILYRVKYKVKKGETKRYQMIAPPTLRSLILRLLHNVRTAGHLGIKKTLARVKGRFYWPGCKKDVTRWCRDCKQCLQKQSGNKRQGKMGHIFTSGPFEVVAMDIVGPLVTTDNGYSYILVLSDHFTRWVEAFPLKDHTAMTVADVLVTQFICRFGIPQRIHSDQGRDFMSNLFKHMCEMLGVKRSRTSPYHPQCDGMVERFNRTLQQMLVSFVKETREDWDDHLPFVLMAYRSAVHESTGCSPNMMVFGRELPGPMDIICSAFTHQAGSLQCPCEYVEWLKQSLEGAFQFARERMKKAALAQKLIYDKSVKQVTFEVGQWVAYFYPPTSRQKLGKGWQAPFLVVKKYSDITYGIQASPDAGVKVVHVNRLRAYRVGDQPDSWLKNGHVCTHTDVGVQCTMEDNDDMEGDVK